MSEDVRSTITLYKRLFSLPEDRTLVVIMVLGSLLIGGITEILRNIGHPVIVYVFLTGALRGLLITLPTATIAILTLWASTRKGGILNWHRLLGVITTAIAVLLIVWFLSTLVGWAIELLLKWNYGPSAGGGLTTMFYLRNLILAAAFTSAIFLLIVLSTSRVGVIRGILLSLIFPTTCILMYIGTEPALIISSSWWTFFIIYFLCALTFICATSILLAAVGRPLKKSFNVDGIQLFRGFLEVWMEGKADLMEQILTEIGQEKVLPFSVLKFSTANKKPYLVKVIPGVHPGPFKNTGSSNLSGRIGEWGREILKATACAPHGTATHDLNLVSKDEVTQFLDMVQEAYDQTSPVKDVTQFISAASGTIKAGCQIFGDTAVLLLTRSPIEMDDISLTVGTRITTEVTKHVKRCILIDTHNCMSELKESVHEDSELVSDMIKAAVSATREALKRSRDQPNIGLAIKRETGFTEAQGMGPEGVTVFIVEVAGQKMAYALIDGNNMVVGLREKIVHALVPRFVDAAEVMTTDTHQTAVVSSQNGYSPIGEQIPHSDLISIITELAEKASSHLEPGTVEIFQGETQPLRIMGEGTVEKLTSLIPVSANVAKRVGVGIYTIAFLISLVLLLFVLPIPLFP